MDWLIMAEEPCIRCGVEIEDDGIIYIRVKGENKPICTQCWEKENPGRPAHRIKWNDDD